MQTIALDAQDARTRLRSGPKFMTGASCHYVLLNLRLVLPNARQLPHAQLTSSQTRIVSYELEGILIATFWSCVLQVLAMAMHGVESIRSGWPKQRRSLRLQVPPTP